MDDRGRLRDRLHDAGLVVGKHERDERPFRLGDGAASAARSTRPSASTGTSRITFRGKRPPARTEECSIAEKRGFAGRFSPAVSIAGDRASMFASVPPEVKNTSAGGADQRRHLLPRGFDQSPGRAPLGMYRGRVAGDRQRIHQGRRASGRNGAVAFQSR